MGVVMVHHPNLIFLATLRTNMYVNGIDLRLTLSNYRRKYSLSVSDFRRSISSIHFEFRSLKVPDSSFLYSAYYH